MLERCLNIKFAYTQYKYLYICSISEFIKVDEKAFLHTHTYYKYEDAYYTHL